MNKFFTIFILLTLPSILSCQDLLDSINDDSEEETYLVSATFKDTKIVNIQSNETPAAGVLHFVIAHRFGRINEGAYALWGLDNASMRIAFDYGITNRISVGVARNTFQKTYEANVKVRVLQESRGGKAFPFSLTWYSSTMCNGMKWGDPNIDNYFTSRLSFVNQAIFTKKLSERLSLAIIPSLVHYNIVQTTSDLHDIAVISAGGRYKLSNRTSINGEYHYRINRTAEDPYENGLSIGFDIDTGGHVFQLHLTNSQGMFERSFLTETVGSWGKGDIYFGFNLSRVFNL